MPLPVTWLTYEYKNGDLKFEFKIVEGDFDYYDVSIKKLSRNFIEKNYFLKKLYTKIVLWMEVKFKSCLSFYYFQWKYINHLNHFNTSN